MVLRKDYIYLAFHSFIRNSGFAELTWHSEMKRKANFLFVFLSFFRNFGRNLKPSLFIGGLGNSTISRLRTGHLLISVFFRDMRIVRALNAEPPAFINGSLSETKVHRIYEIIKLWEDFSLILL